MDKPWKPEEISANLPKDWPDSRGIIHYRFKLKNKSLKILNLKEYGSAMTKKSQPILTVMIMF